jgi:hypothetical protein
MEEGKLSGAANEGRDGHKIEKRVEKAAAVPKAILGQIRSSPRLQRSRDEHTLAKAEKSVAKKNLELGEVSFLRIPYFLLIIILLWTVYNLYELVVVVPNKIN